MIISHKHKYIFIHCHKCAGTTIEQQLNKSLGDFDIIVGSTKQGEQLQKNSEKWSHWKHATADDISNNHNYAWQKYYKFASVRNPYDRVVSWYFWWKTKWYKGSNKIKMIHIGNEVNKMTFDEYVKSIFTWQTSTLFNYHRMLFTDKFEMDGIIRCENIQSDFDKVCNKLKIKKIQLPYRNASKHKHYSNYYTDESTEIVYQQFKKDIKYFGYEFGK